MSKNKKNINFLLKIFLFHYLKISVYGMGKFLYYCNCFRAADPKCEIFLVGWKGKTQIKAETDAKTDIVHFLRLCGIDNPNKS